MTPKITPLLDQLLTTMDLLVCSPGECGECESCPNDAKCNSLAESIVAEKEAIRMSGDIDNLVDLLEEV